MTEKTNDNPDLSSEIGMPSSANESLQGDTKQCPCCGYEIKAKARICRFCGARFEIATKGYCTNCHKLVGVDDTNRCSECGGEVIDPHVISNLIQSPAPSQPASQPVTTATLPLPVMGHTRDTGISPGAVPPRTPRYYSAQTAIGEVATLVAEALEIIETKAVQIVPGGIIKSGGDVSDAMDAAKKLEQTHRLQPDDAWLHYAWASALHLAMQYKTAREEMERLMGTHPDFLWAKLALEGWDRWDGLFTLPSWEPGIKSVHPMISAEVKRGYVLGSRHELEPRATLFLRDTEGDFQGLTTLESTRIDITTVLSDSEPLLAVVYARIWDNPTNPYQVEALGLPLNPHGSKQRCKYGYLCLQEEIDFAIIDNRDKILLNKRLTIPDRMKSVHTVLWDRLSTSPGREYSDMELVNAVRSFQSRFSLSDVQY